MANPEDVAAAAAVVEPVYIIQREVQVKRFHGGEPHHTAEAFEEEIRRAWKTNRATSRDAKYEMLMANIGPSVRTELRCHALDDDPETTLEKIVEIYGERRTPAQLLQEFYRLQQFSGEPVREYSHRLLTAFETIQGRCRRLNRPEQEASTLRDQFANSLQDQVLGKILREKVNDNPVISFRALRETAIRWTEDSASISSSAVSAQTKTNYDERINKLEGMVSTLLTKLDTLVTEQTNPCKQNHKDRQNRSERSERQPERQNHRRPKGRPDRHGDVRCFKCGSLDHLQARCPGNE